MWEICTGECKRPENMDEMNVCIRIRTCEPVAGVFEEVSDVCRGKSF